MATPGKAKAKPARSAFVVSPIGSVGTPERERADDVYEFIIAPVAEELGLRAMRADHDPTPGPVTSQIIKELLGATVIIADLSDRNASVYYEVAVAHCFGKPMVMLIDEPDSLAFDAKDERVISIGPAPIRVRRAMAARKELKRALERVLVMGYLPHSLMTSVAATRKLEDLAPSDAVASELGDLRVMIQNLQAAVARLSPYGVLPFNFSSEPLQGFQVAPVVTGSTFVGKPAPTIIVGSGFEKQRAAGNRPTGPGSSAGKTSK
jgi:hypothetical protein